LKEKQKTAEVEAPEDQLSLAIGKDGQNARLASKLTGWRIEVEGAPTEDKVEDKKVEKKKTTTKDKKK
jgi:N utilization substance protein A